ncbi:unnamed protein product [Soboliphyme baturini]|uniref:Splicing factor 45 n=1 Tax=Soboliphyme baturini TaxID=241478 RepID=A0A183J1V1_9BILA|nr:unnamed protein product [Soboliphyme baturini]
MSLYEGLDEDPAVKPKDGEKLEATENWKSGLKLLQTHIHLKKATLLQRDKPKIGGGSSPVDTSIKRKGEISKTTKTVLVDAPPLSFLPIKDSISNAEEWHVDDEYNPLLPNDFERLIRQREEDRLMKLSKVKYALPTEDDWEAETNEEVKEREKRSKPAPHLLLTYPSSSELTVGAAIAPPPNLIEEDRHASEDTAPPATSLADTGQIGKGLNVATRIMERYGYKQGSGLGKLEQGMSTPLLVEKTGLRGGKIIHEKDIPKEVPMPVPVPAYLPAPAVEQNSLGESITEILKSPSKNMVGPGEVDEELEPEVKEEMQKYGEVVKCLIFEMPSVPENEAVRIFVEFSKVDQAIKAAVALNGRYFAGRIVQAGFYDVDNFHNLQLTD